MVITAEVLSRGEIQVNEFIIWYLLIANIPNSTVAYNKPIGPFSQERCEKTKTIFAEYQNTLQIATMSCKKAIGFRTCRVEDTPYMSISCPIFEK